ncbi:MAG: F0F1 ATP synthase subunit I [Hyphomicrobiales bacterium]|nr:MAG: F0F1 ATP synthase subunit I [Hyphomicrobiales bacterium]
MAIIRLKCLTVIDVFYIFRPTSFVFLELRRMTDPKTDKLKEFDEKLKAAKKPKEVKEKSQEHKAMSNAYGYATELLAGFLIGAVMGWSLDSWLETKPLFMIVFIFIGAGAGIFNVIKSSKRDFEEHQKAEQQAADEKKNNKN